MSVRTTKKHYALFVKEVERWAAAFGFRDWKLYTYHSKLDPGNFAECEWDLGHRVAYLRLSTHLSDEAAPPTVASIKRVALHECLELLLCQCTTTMREARPRDFVSCETHKIIRVLENVLAGEAK